jgi:hypothetical protein
MLAPPRFTRVEHTMRVAHGGGRLGTPAGKERTPGTPPRPPRRHRGPTGVFERGGEIAAHACAVGWWGRVGPPGPSTRVHLNSRESWESWGLGWGPRIDQCLGDSHRFGIG